MSLYWRDRGETRTADLIDALAAQPTVDEAKLAEVIRGSMTYKREFEGGQTSLGWNSYPEVARLVNERREEWLRCGGR